MAMKDNSERIERFLRDQMSEEENAAFVSDLQSDPALREQAQIMALLIKGMKDERKEQERVVVDSTLPAAAKPVPAAANNNNGIFTKVLFWACAMAAMFVLVFQIVKSSYSYEGMGPQMAPLDSNPQKQVADNGNTGKLAQNPTGTKTEQEQKQDVETTAEGGELSELEIHAGAAKVNSIVRQLAELDQKLANDKDLELVIFELRNILDNIQSHNEYYARYEPYENKIKRMLYDAYIKTDDLSLALEMKKSLDDTEWAINQDDE